MASPESLQQRFLAAVLNTSREPLNDVEKVLAIAKFYTIMDRYSKRRRERSSKLIRHLLIQYTYEFALSEESQFHFLQVFFEALDLTVAGAGRVNLNDREQADELWTTISAFANFLVDSFYLPLVKAAARRQPLSSLKAQPPVPEKVTDPRADCLKREGHRCIITQAFEFDEAVKRHKQHASNARDDVGRPLIVGNRFLHLEAAPIIPHSFAETGSDPSPTKELMLTILDMLDHGIVALIDECVGTTRNAMALTKNYHHMWSEFEFFFTPHGTASHQPHTYDITAFVNLSMRRELPATRRFCTEADGRPFAPPEPRFLALRRALAHILYYSRAGPHIDEMLERIEKAAEDGTGGFGEPRLDSTAATGVDDVGAVANAVAAITIAADVDADVNVEH
ncbi:hypothetical protein ACQKWADRAFT_331232 [Trichoderma austrokoningii]